MPAQGGAEPGRGEGWLRSLECPLRCPVVRATGLGEGLRGPQRYWRAEGVAGQEGVGQELGGQLAGMPRGLPSRNAEAWEPPPGARLRVKGGEEEGPPNQFLFFWLKHRDVVVLSFLITNMSKLAGFIRKSRHPASAETSRDLEMQAQAASERQRAEEGCLPQAVPALGSAPVPPCPLGSRAGRRGPGVLQT